MSRYSSREREAVNAVSTKVTSELDWIFRELPLLDFGIDGHIEISNENEPQNKIISVQIKGGDSYLEETKESDGKYFTFYFSKTHYHYWLNSTVPVLGLFHSDNGTIYWQKLDQKTMQKANSGYKIEIPKTNVLNNSSTPELLQYYDDWKPKSNYPILDKSSEFKGLLGIGNYFLIIQSLVKLKDAISTHRLNYQIENPKFGKVEGGDKIEEISFQRQIQLQKLKLSTRILKARINTEIEFITEMAAEQFRAFAFKISFLEDDFSSNRISENDILNEYEKILEAEQILGSAIDDLLNVVNKRSLRDPSNKLLELEYKELSKIIMQMEKELRMVKGYQKLVRHGIERLISKIKNK